MVTRSGIEKSLIFTLRVCLAWVFLWAAMRQLTGPFTAASFLSGAKTFGSIYAWLASPAVLPIINAVIPWVHLLLGISLLLGLSVRLSSVGGAVLLMLYYFPRLDFPYVVSPTNFLVEYHLVYALLLVYLGVIGAGRVWGLDGWLASLPPVSHYLARHPGARALMS